MTTTQEVERVRRRLTASIHAKEIDRTMRLRGWTHDAVVDLLMLCGGDMQRVNAHHRAMRAQSNGIGHLHGERTYRALFDYIASHEEDR